MSETLKKNLNDKKKVWQLTEFQEMTEKQSCWNCAEMM